MKSIFSIGKNDKGSVLLISVMILFLVTIIGVAATNTSKIEILISGCDKVHKMAFQQADGGTEVGIELVEQNINLAGFNTTELANLEDVNATNAQLYLNGTPDKPSNSNRDAYLPRNYIGNGPHTNLTIGGNTSFLSGSAIQMAAGYEGQGKGAAGGGAKIIYDIYSQHLGMVNSKDIILLQWMHVM